MSKSRKKRKGRGESWANCDWVKYEKVERRRRAAATHDWVELDEGEEMGKVMGQAVVGALPDLEPLRAPVGSH
jgi:hypothetical protein